MFFVFIDEWSHMNIKGHYNHNHKIKPYTWMQLFSEPQLFTCVQGIKTGPHTYGVNSLLSEKFPQLVCFAFPFFSFLSLSPLPPLNFLYTISKSRILLAYTTLLAKLAGNLQYWVWVLLEGRVSQKEWAPIMSIFLL